MSRGGADIVAGQKYWSKNRVGNHRDTFKDETQGKRQSWEISARSRVRKTKASGTSKGKQVLQCKHVWNARIGMLGANECDDVAWQRGKRGCPSPQRKREKGGRQQYREVRIQDSKEQGELRKGESAKSRGYEGDTDAKAEAGLQAEERKGQGEGNERDSELQEWVTEGECTYATWCTLKP
ncbi:hypothetical protein B0H13DRAFT_1898980 [Mycena leptocephala]|nr:hypothetical protein B0H13DRAFT_1898980 [Mycena leptocephala]